MWSKIKSFFAKHFTNTNWIHTAQTLIAVIAPVLNRLLGQFAGADVAAEASSIMNEVVTDFGAVSALLGQVQSGDTSAVGRVRSLVGGINTNLSTLLTAGHIKNANAQADATMVVQELSALLSEIPTA